MPSTRPRKGCERLLPRAGAVIERALAVKINFDPLQCSSGDPSRQVIQDKGQRATRHHWFWQAHPESSVCDTDPVAPGVLCFIGGSVRSLPQRDQRLTNMA